MTGSVLLAEKGRSKSMRAVGLGWQRCIYLATILLGAGSASLHAAESGVPSNEDLRHVRSLADPQVSPDGDRVLIRVTDATADGGRQHAWLLDVGANTSRQLTFSPTADKQGEHDARWLGDGSSVVFLAKRTEHAQLYRLPMSGGEAHPYELKIAPLVDESEEPDAIPPKKAGDAPVSKEPIMLDVEKYEPAPDGHTIAVIAPDPQTPG
jgi:dipeptidyl aminopeptidase/acylaminoacyl peptidase